MALEKTWTATSRRLWIFEFQIAADALRSMRRVLIRRLSNRSDLQEVAEEGCRFCSAFFTRMGRLVWHVDDGGVAPSLRSLWRIRARLTQIAGEGGSFAVGGSGDQLLYHRKNYPRRRTA